MGWLFAGAAALDRTTSLRSDQLRRSLNVQRGVAQSPKRSPGGRLFAPKSGRHAPAVQGIGFVSSLKRALRFARSSQARARVACMGARLGSNAETIDRGLRAPLASACTWVPDAGVPDRLERRAVRLRWAFALGYAVTPARAEHVPVRQDASTRSRRRKHPLARTQAPGRRGSRARRGRERAHRAEGASAPDEIARAAIRSHVGHGPARARVRTSCRSIAEPM
jgi:hypothetical protein